MILLAGLNSLLIGESTIAIENAEQFWLYYIIDPGYLRTYKYTDPNYAHYVLKFFAGSPGSVDFTPLSPGQVHYYNNLTMGEHVLVGFFVPDDKLVFPVKVINIIVDKETGERRYVVNNTTSNISVTTGTGLLTNFVPDHVTNTQEIIREQAVDNDYTDWSSIPVAAAFSKNFNPVYFNQEVDGSMKTLPIESSLYWKFGGTQLENFKAVLDEFSCYFYFSTYRNIAEGLIIYMYLYKDREKVQNNLYTIEININGKDRSGIVYLWEKGNPEPVKIGSCTSSGYYLEGRIELHFLPEQVRQELIAKYSFDLTTCYFNKDSRLYEEFFYTTIYFRDIPGKVELLQHSQGR